MCIYIYIHISCTNILNHYNWWFHPHIGDRLEDAAAGPMKGVLVGGLSGMWPIEPVGPWVAEDFSMKATDFITEFRVEKRICPKMGELLFQNGLKKKQLGLMGCTTNSRICPRPAIYPCFIAFLIQNIW